MSDLAPESRSNATEYTVSEISGALKRTVEDTFGHVRVRGEISGYRGPHSSGHAYFALKDDRARLEAEAEGKDQIDFPPELAKTAAGKKLMADETNLMQARQKRLRLQLASLDDLKRLLQAEIESLQKKIATQSRQTDLSREELKGLGNLAGKGLVVNQRVLTLEQTIAELEGKLLDMDTAILRAKQDIAKATQDAISLQNDRDTEIAQTRQQTESDLDALNLKMGMYSGLMTEALERAPDAARNAGGRNPPETHYTIVRTDGDGKAGEVEADENTPVLPGDVIKVEVTPSVVNSN